MKKKVLYVATVDVHIKSFHLPYLKMLHDKGYEVHVATNGNETFPYCDVKHQICIERNPFKIANLKAIKQLKKIIESEKFDIIHCHTPMGSVVARFAAKKARKKYNSRVIYTAHGFHFYKGAPKLNWMLFYSIEKYLAKFTDTLITINHEDYNLALNKFSKRCHDIEYVPGVGIDENKFNFKMSMQEKRELRNSLGLKDDDFIMLYPAEISVRKRQLWLIDAVSNLLKENSNIHLLLPGRDSLNGKCQSRVHELNLDNQIHFLGFRNDISKLLKISDVAVSASSQEGLPVNIMEAMYIGLPIVASDCRGNRDLVVDEKNGYLIELYNSEKFSKSISLLYKNNNDSFALESKKMIKKYLLQNVLCDLEKIYFNTNKKIYYLRSTAIYNDSRATKEINSYKNNGIEVVALGWNRLNEKINLDNNEYVFYEKSAVYGAGIKSIFKLFGFNKWIKKTLKKNLKEFDIIHACDLDTAYSAYKICKKYNKKLVYDIYDYYVESHNVSFLKRLVEKIDIKIINSADCVIICTEQRKKQISKSCPKKLEIIHNTPIIDLSIFDNKKYKVNHKKINICYVGILQPNRLLIEISEELKDKPNIELFIGGFGIYEEYFKQMSNQYSNIHFLGSMCYKNVLELESNCDYLFATYDNKIPNHLFSAPNKLYESMALGKPIIVCNGTGVDLLVKNEVIGFTINYDAKEFVEKIEKCSREKYELFSKNCKKLYNDKYNWKIMEDRLYNIIKEIRFNGK